MDICFCQEFLFEVEIILVVLCWNFFKCQTHRLETFDCSMMVTCFSECKKNPLTHSLVSHVRTNRSLGAILFLTILRPTHKTIFLIYKKY